jgi:hypothetical protein
LTSFVAQSTVQVHTHSDAPIESDCAITLIQSAWARDLGREIPLLNKERLRPKFGPESGIDPLETNTLLATNRND